LGRATSFAYDVLNRRISTTDVLGQTQAIAYDAVGNVISTTNELGRVSSYVYDVLNRRTQAIDPLGQTQTTAYDSEGNIVSVADGLGHTTTYAYDVLNRRVRATDANGGITSTSYDAAGNVSRITDAVGNSTTYGYDAVDRLLTETNQLGFSRSRVYDAVGNQIEMVDRNGRKIVYGYDALNRRTSESWLDADAQSIRLHSYSYNALGNLITAIEPDSKYTYGYDALNRLVTLDNAGTNGVPTVIFGYVYDGIGRLMSVSDRINGTNASQTSYAYDQLNRVTQITQSGAGVQNKRVDMVYNAVNQMIGLRRYSDLSGATLVAETSYVHDLNQRLTQLAHKRGANNLVSYDYTYDAADKLTKIVSSIDGTVDYAYDATNQLTGANHTNQTDEAYQYDANGNRTNSGYQTGTNNQLLSDGQFTYEYDNEGNRTKRTETATGRVTEYVWDYRNRLTQVLFKDGTGAVTKNVEYVYDVNNLRIGKKIDGVVRERFAINRNQIALVFDGQGVQKSRYLYGTEVDQVLAEESGAQVHWFLADHQGTVKDVVNNTGVIVDHVTYDSFGRIVGQTGNIELRFAYTGREWDGETGQYYYRARYYDAVVGRFISEDPIGFSGGDANIYRYVKNDSVNERDPSGLGPATLILSITPMWARKEFKKENYREYNNYYVPSDGRLSLRPQREMGWRPILARAFNGDTQHVLKFMDHYFDKKGAIFNLNNAGILDSIRRIPTIKQGETDIKRDLFSKAFDELAKTKPLCNNKKSFRKDFTLSIKTLVDVTEYNVSLGRFWLESYTSMTILGDQGKVKFTGYTSYVIDNMFEDVADIKSVTPKIMDELPGGVAYKIYGSWGEKFNTEVPVPIETCPKPKC
jgi:RHS repeat-associated protein